MRKRVVLIAGGSSGIGAAIAMRLAQAGAVGVAVTYANNRKGADRVVSQVQELGCKALALQLRAAEHSGLSRVVESTQGELGPIDVAVNCVGISRIARIAEPDFWSSWTACQEVNVDFLWRFLLAVVPGMKERGFGRFVNVSSVSAHETRSGVASYAISKGTQNAIIRHAARELAEYGILINAVLPGMVDTPHLRESNTRLAERAGKTLEQVNAGILSETWTGKMVAPEEVAECVALLASERNHSLIGESLAVGGGRGCRT